MRAVLTAINSKYIHTALGARYVAGYARAQGHEVRLIEESVNSRLLDVLEKIMREEADAYAFSLHIWNKDFVLRLVSLVRKLRPQAALIVGGPEASFTPEALFREQPAIDYIVQGEGEIAFSELLRSLERGEGIPPHIACRERGEMRASGGPAVLEDLRLLPFPYPDLERVLAEEKIIYYECTRGCPFGCSYCLSGRTRRVRRRPLGMVLADLDRFLAAGAPLVKFVDRTYNLDEDYFLPIMEHLAAARTQATFHFEIKADILSERVLRFLETVPKGRFQLEIGIQSTHQPTLAAINRRDDWQKLAANVRRLLRGRNMHIHVDLIAGLPYEDIETFGKSFDDAYALGAQMLQLGFLKVLPGTRMRAEEGEHGLVYMDEPPYEILATKYMPYEDLQLLRRVENVFEQTGNSGVFPHILPALMRCEELKPFAFFRKLSCWWTERGYYPQTHNAKGVAAILARYIKENFAGGDARRHELMEILRYDVFCQLPPWRPEWLAWQGKDIFAQVAAFWRDEELARKYVPGYKASSWRQINKSYPIEFFDRHWEDGRAGAFWVLLDNAGEERRVIVLPREIFR